MRKSPRRSSAGLLLVLLALAAGQQALAHGLGNRFDLPLPLEFWVVGAAGTVLLSFVLMASFVRAAPRGVDYPRLSLLDVPAIRRLAHPALLAVVRVLAVFIFLLTIVAGLYGTPDPFRNFAPTMIWVIGWIGMVFVSALLGDVWAVVNPLATLFAWVEATFERQAGSRLTLELPYPARLGLWPAVGALLVFAWAQLIWLKRDVPADLALLAVAYAIWTWGGMFTFGRVAWLRHGEVFAVAFGLLARLAPFEIRVERDKVDWNLRPPAVGLLEQPVANLSGVVFVLAMLSTVSFDGLLETAFWQEIARRANAPGLAATAQGQQLLDTVGLIAMPGVFLALYLLCTWAMARVTRSGAERTAGRLACAFVLTLVPIALAYDLAHNLSMFLTAGQFIIPLASDPLGYGWNLWGTAGFKVNLLIVDAETVWYFAVFVILLGHVASVYLAHVAALQLFRDRRAALLSQVPMVVLMMVYTMSSLWILAQPIVA